MRDNLWHKDGHDNIELCKAHSFYTSSNLCQCTSTLLKLQSNYNKGFKILKFEKVMTEKFLTVF